MGRVVPFRRKEEKQGTPEAEDLTALLKGAVELRGSALGHEINGVFRMKGNFEELLKARLGSFIIENRLITTDLFRCSLYIAHLLNETVSRNFESLYAVDYYLRGVEEQDPAALQQGADLCSVLCILFEGRRNWRMVREGDYARRGVQLYALYYAQTKRMIAWCMSRNFESIVAITRKCLAGLEKDCV